MPKQRNEISKQTLQSTQAFSAIHGVTVFTAWALQDSNTELLKQALRDLQLEAQKSKIEYLYGKDGYGLQDIIDALNCVCNEGLDYVGLLKNNMIPKFSKVIDTDTMLKCINNSKNNKKFLRNSNFLRLLIDNNMCQYVENKCKTLFKKMSNYNAELKGLDMLEAMITELDENEAKVKSDTLPIDTDDDQDEETTNKAAYRNGATVVLEGPQNAKPKKIQEAGKVGSIQNPTQNENKKKHAIASITNDEKKVKQNKTNKSFSKIASVTNQDLTKNSSTNKAKVAKERSTKPNKGVSPKKQRGSKTEYSDVESDSSASDEGKFKSTTTATKKMEGSDTEEVEKINDILQADTEEEEEEDAEEEKFVGDRNRVDAVLKQADKEDTCHRRTLQLKRLKNNSGKQGSSLKKKTESAKNTVLNNEKVATNGQKKKAKPVLEMKSDEEGEEEEEEDTVSISSEEDNKNLSSNKNELNNVDESDHSSVDTEDSNKESVSSDSDDDDEEEEEENESDNDANRKINSVNMEKIASNAPKRKKLVSAAQVPTKKIKIRQEKQSKEKPSGSASKKESIMDKLRGVQKQQQKKSSKTLVVSPFAIDQTRKYLPSSVKPDIMV